MATKQIRGIAVPRHDTAINWAKAINFIPQKGEIIIYDADAAGTVYPTSLTINGTDYSVSELGQDITPSTTTRIKVGDGSTKVSYLPYLLGATGDSDSSEELSQIELDTIEAKSRGIEPVSIKLGSTYEESNGSTSFLYLGMTATGALADWIAENGVLLVATQDGSVFSGTCNYMSGEAYTTVPAVTVNSGDFIFLSPAMVNQFDLASDIHNGLTDFGFQGSGSFDLYLSNYNSEQDKFFKVVGSNETEADMDYYNFSLSFYIDSPDQLFYVYTSNADYFSLLYDDCYINDSEGNSVSIGTFISPNDVSTLDSYTIPDLSDSSFLYPVRVECIGYNKFNTGYIPTIEVLAEYTPELPESDITDIDSELSETSSNPVQNKVITAALNSKLDGPTGKNILYSSSVSYAGVSQADFNSKIYFDVAAQATISLALHYQDTDLARAELEAKEGTYCLNDYVDTKETVTGITIYGVPNLDPEADAISAIYTKAKLTESSVVPLTLTVVDDETGEESTIVYQLIAVE